VQEMVYLKAIQKSAPMGVSVSGTIDQKTYLKKCKGVFSPLNIPWISLWSSRILYKKHDTFSAYDQSYTFAQPPA